MGEDSVSDGEDSGKLGEELRGLRRREGVTRRKLTKCPVLMQYLNPDDPVQALQDLCAELGDTKQMRALMNAYAFGVKSPQNLTKRRYNFAEQIAAEEGRMSYHVDTVELWENQAIDELVQHLRGGEEEQPTEEESQQLTEAELARFELLVTEIEKMELRRKYSGLQHTILAFSKNHQEQTRKQVDQLHILRSAVSDVRELARKTRRRRLKKRLNADADRLLQTYTVLLASVKASYKTHAALVDSVIAFYLLEDRKIAESLTPEQVEYLSQRGILPLEAAEEADNTEEAEAAGEGEEAV